MIDTLAVGELDLDAALNVWDVRDAKAYNEAHLKGAQNKPLQALTKADLDAVSGTVHVLCGGGTRAAKAAALLDSFDPERRIVILAGGTRKAKALGLPIETAS